VIKQRLLQVDTPANLRSSLYGRHVVVRMRAVSDAHEAVVRALPFVRSVAREDDRLILALDDPDAMTPSVVSALVGAGAEIQSVGEERHSLEEVYLSLVEKGNTAQ
jgi:ABC-2 type transport system ATP-binding protein